MKIRFSVGGEVTQTIQPLMVSDGSRRYSPAEICNVLKSGKAVTTLERELVDQESNFTTAYVELVEEGTRIAEIVASDLQTEYFEFEEIP